MFVYSDDGLPVDYEYYNDDPNIQTAVREHMMEWIRRLPGSSRVRLGKIGMMQGSTVNLRRMENE